MAQLIEISVLQRLPLTLSVEVGDLLLFRVTGGHIQSGEASVELLGPYQSGTLLDNGQTLTPEGLPNAVLFMVHAPGRARIEVITGGFGQALDRRTVELLINQ